MRRILDPRLRASTTEMWESRVTIQLITTTEEASGQKMPTGVTSVPGMIGLECRMAPLILLRPEDSEVRDIPITELYERRQLKINKYLPTLLPHVMQAVVDGKTWQIRGVEADGSSFSTRLKLENVKP